MKKLLGRGGPLAVFYEYPVLLQLGLICTCAETAWATLLFVMEFYFKEELLIGETEQFIASKIAFAFLAFAGAETLFKYPMGALADKYGPRRFVYLALSICSVTPLLMWLLGTRFHTWVPFIPLRAADGFAAAALWPAMSALMSRAVPREAKAASMSVFNAAYCLGLAIGPTTGLLIGHLLGTNLKVFPVCTLLMLTGLGIAFFSINKKGDKTEFHGENLTDEKALLRGRPMLWRMMAIYAFSQLGVGILAPTVPVYIDNQFGLKQENLPQLLIYPAFLIVLVAIPLGRLPDKLGKARAVWISYALAAGGMVLIALTSRFDPIPKPSLTLPMAMFGIGIGAMVVSYILGTPAWLGLTSLQVDDSKQAQALSLMQTAQGFGVVCAFALVASGGHLMTTAQKMITRANQMGSHIHFKNRQFHLPPQFNHPLKDEIPLSVWFWVAAAVFVLCLVGTLLFVREISHSENESDETNSAAQPLELTGM